MPATSLIDSSSLRRRALPVAATLLVALAIAPSCADRSGRERFETDVAPLLERRCLSAPCHGVAPDAEARGETIDWTHFYVRTTADGRVADVAAAYAMAKSRIDPARPELSTLVRKPLAVEEGGLGHAGGAVFRARDDAAFATVRAWIASESSGGEAGRFEDLTPLEQRFATDVLPRLATRQCMNAACHGASSPFTAFEPPMAIDGALVFSFAGIRKNHAAARMHLFLAGDPTLSRLVRKALPLGGGGIAHRGGNAIFFDQSTTGDPMGDPSVRAIAGWADAERAALGVAPGLRGIVFVRGAIAPASPFAHDRFAPGTDLWVLAPTSAPVARNLTASAHAGAADVRDPAVSHEAARVAFAMRTSVDDALNIYEIGVDGSGLRQLTFDALALPGGGRAANAQPTYGPDGRIYFASTRAGHVADGGATLDAEIWAVDPETRALERITHDPMPEATPTFFGTGKSYGTLAFSVLRGIGGKYKGAVFRAPLDHNKAFHGDPELHVHHGLTLDADVLYGARAMPDGRFVATELGLANVWRAGRLAIFDRQLGPEVPLGAEGAASEPGYRRASTSLDDAASAAGVSGGAYRHAAPLPDGRVLVSWAAGPIDLGDERASPRFGVWALTLAEDAATGRTRVVARDRVFGDSVDSAYDAEPIAPRPREDDPSHARAWDPAKTTGVLAYRHVETLEAIMSSLAPTGAKTVRGDLAYARVIASLPLTPDDLAAPIAVGPHGRTRILAEVPLAGGSLQLEVPASTPLRIQTLDANRMAVGTQHNRWIDVAPGQTFPGGVAPRLYPTLCAGCHGSLSGSATDVARAVPDLVASASVTLATHANLDPRRPLAPVRVGDAPIAIDFRRDVAPLLARSCASCHGGAAPAGGLSLEARATARFDTAYEALLAPGDGSGGGRRYVDDASAFTSYLVERILGRELGAARARRRVSGIAAALRRRAPRLRAVDRSRRGLPRGRAVWRLLVALAVGCATPTQGDVPVAELDRAAFEARVEPVLAARCANPSCHGRPERPLSIYAATRWRADASRTFYDEPLTTPEMDHDYAAACLFAGAADPAHAPLLLRKSLGGPDVYHGGGAVFDGETDPEYRALRAWIEGTP